MRKAGWTPSAMVGWLLAALILFHGGAARASETAPEAKAPPQAQAQSAPGKDQSAEETWGVRVQKVRLTASGHFVDFRYRVLNSEKASVLLQRKKQAFLLHQETGQAVTVPVTKLGPIRQTAVKPPENRNYFVLFSNPNGLVKKGDLVTVSIGDFRVEDLIVQ